jgi:nucleotide-binding universal stress UspA family protein
MKLLIGYDGSACAEAALDDLKFAGIPDKAEALVLSVIDVWGPPPPPSIYEIVEEAMMADSPVEPQRNYISSSEAVEEAPALSSRAVERLMVNFPGWEVKAEGRYGSAASEIIKKADEWKPDLIVVGSHGHSALGRFALGSVSQKVLTEARCSVRVARGRIELDDSTARILIGIDGSASADAAVHAVAARSWLNGSEARVVMIDEPLTPTLVGKLIPKITKLVDEVNKDEQKWARDVVEKAAALLREAGLTVSTLLRNGDPKRELVRLAEEWSATSIFLGSTGFHNRFERFLLGSVSAAVAARAHCSVEVVREREAVLSQAT